MYTCRCCAVLCNDRGSDAEFLNLCDACYEANSENAESEAGALERFNEDMSHALCDGHRNAATAMLAVRIGNQNRADDFRKAWMQQHRESVRELNA
jgi:hypothetical protein